MDDTDTDTLIAIVQSLLEPTIRSTADILEALASSNGDCTAAARRLSSSAPSSSLTKKHHHQPKVADWAKPKTDPADVPRRKKVKMSSSSFFSTSSANASNPLPNAVIDLTTPELSLSTLKQAPTKPRAPTASKPPASNKPLVLANSLLLEKHLPCIVVPPSPIPIYTASSLYLSLLKESESWAPITWWIGGKEVESPHTSSFYASSSNPPDYTPEQLTESAKYWYNGKPTPPPLPFPPLLQEVADLIEPIVNEEIRKRARFDGEWQGDWKANVCAVNRYEGADQSVGAHADQLTYLGPYPTIASVSLGTTRHFRLRQVQSKDPAIRSTEVDARTYDVPLKNNTLLIMHPPCQERYKHSVPAQKAIDVFRPGWAAEGERIQIEDRHAFKSRIGITFRFYRPDFSPARTPICRCGLPCCLKADQKLLLQRLAANPPPPPPSSASSHSTQQPSQALSRPDGKSLPGSTSFFWMCNRKLGAAAGADGDDDGGGPRGCDFFEVLQKGC